MSFGFVPAASDTKGEEWVKAQREVEEKRREKAKEGMQEGGKSLYEVLQANKAAKQEAFEESIRLKNQFRTLDEGEVEFLDTVLERDRAREAAVKEETVRGLESFRQQREKAEREEMNQTRDTTQTQDDDWKMRKKRKRDRDRASLPSTKARRTSSTGEAEKNSDLAQVTATSKSPERQSPTMESSEKNPRSGGTQNAQDDPTPINKSSPTSKKAALPPPGLGLGAYSSDED